MKRSMLYIAIAFITGLYSCNSKQSHSKEEEHHHEEHEEGVVFLNDEQSDALGLKLGSFHMRNLTTVVKTNGSLEVPPGSRAEVTAFIGGNVKSIRVFHGDKVNKGDVLATLEHPDYIKLQEDFAEAANQLDFLEQEYNRQKELYENNVGSGKDFQKVKSEYNIAKSRYAGLYSRLQLVNLSAEKVKEGIITNSIPLLAPISGYVNDINIKVGSFVSDRDKLFEIVNNNDIHADFLVYENDASLLKVGQKIDFSVSNKSGEELSATIFAIGKQFEGEARAIHVHAKIDSSYGNLIPGMYVSGRIHTDTIYTRALPNDAIVTDGTKSYVFVLDNSLHEEHEEEGHDHMDEEGDHHDESKIALKKTEVITGKKDEGYTEIKFLDSVSSDKKIALNAAYYLMADLGKEQTEHHH